MRHIPAPLSEHYNSYYGLYIDRVLGKDIYHLLTSNSYAVPAFLYDIPADKWHYRYAPGKWSIAEVVMHMMDAEQVFCYRALRIARGDKTPLAGFDQDAFVQTCNVEEREQSSVIEEYHTTRHATLALINGLNENVAHFIGNASGWDVSFAALCHIIAGHEEHHMEVIKTRYLDGA